MEELSFWLNSNKIALNVAKPEAMLFKTKHKTCDTDLRVKLCRKRLYKTKYLRYLGIKIDGNLNSKIHKHDLASKLNRTYAVLAKLMHFLNLKIHLFCYISFLFKLWMHSLGTYMISSTTGVYSPKKAPKSMNFAPFCTFAYTFVQNCNILNFAVMINVESCIFINNCFNRHSSSIFNENFKLVSPTHSYNTRSARNGTLFVPSYNTVRFGKK